MEPNKIEFIPINGLGISSILGIWQRDGDGVKGKLKLSWLEECGWRMLGEEMFL